jgi:hypothetical protein
MTSSTTTPSALAQLAVACIDIDVENAWLSAPAILAAVDEAIFRSERRNLNRVPRHTGVDRLRAQIGFAHDAGITEDVIIAAIRSTGGKTISHRVTEAVLAVRATVYRPSDNDAADLALAEWSATPSVRVDDDPRPYRGLEGCDWDELGPIPHPNPSSLVDYDADPLFAMFGKSWSISEERSLKKSGAWWVGITDEPHNADQDVIAELRSSYTAERILQFLRRIPPYAGGANVNADGWQDTPGIAVISSWWIIEFYLPGAIKEWKAGRIETYAAHWYDPSFVEVETEDLAIAA